MEFAEFCTIVYPLLKSLCKSKSELFDLLILNCINSENENLIDEISLMTSKNKTNIVNGKTSFGHIASKIYGFFDDTELCNRLDNDISPQPLKSYLSKLKTISEDIDESNFSEKLSESLLLIVEDAASSYRRVSTIEKSKIKAAVLNEYNYFCLSCGSQLSFASNLIKLDKKKDLSEDNAIMLCKECYDKYLNGSLDHLCRLKKAQKNDGDLFSISIDYELSETIKRLLELPGEKGSELNFKGLKIDSKIDPKANRFLSEKIKNMVTLYFPTLNQCFHNEDGDKRRSFEKLASSIRLSFLTIEEKTSDQEAIFEFLVNEIKRKTECRRTIAEIIVSYFVQDCEVFDEVSK